MVGAGDTLVGVGSVQEDIMKYLWVALAAVLLAGCAVVPVEPYGYASPSVSVGVGAPVYRPYYGPYYGGPYYGPYYHPNPYYGYRYPYRW